MSIKEKLFGGPQNPSQPVIDDNIVNPQYYIMPDGSVASDANPENVNGGNPIQSSFPQKNNKPVAYPQNGYPQNGYQQNGYQQANDQQNYPVMNNEDQFRMQQEDQPNGYPVSSAQGNYLTENTQQYQQNAYPQEGYQQTNDQQTYPVMNNQNQPNGYPVSSAQENFVTDNSQQYQQDYPQEPYPTNNGTPGDNTGWNNGAGE